MATLVSRITDLSGAVRDKLNLMMPRLLPAGGSTGQVLGKSSGTDYATSWQTIPKITVGTTAPSEPQVGEIWIDTN